jgi:hypothetical protein
VGSGVEVGKLGSAGAGKAGRGVGEETRPQHVVGVCEHQRIASHGRCIVAGCQFDFVERVAATDDIHNDFIQIGIDLRGLHIEAAQTRIDHLIDDAKIAHAQPFADVEVAHRHSNTQRWAARHGAEQQYAGESCNNQQHSDQSQEDSNGRPDLRVHGFLSHEIL